MHHSYLDRFGRGDSLVHRLDARVKLIALVAYTLVLISFDRYAVTLLFPMAIGPAALIWLAGVPLWFALRRVVVLSPFILMLCLLSPLYDRAVHVVVFGPWQFRICGGWLTAADIAVKFTLGVVALTAVVSSTPFAQLLEAMRRLGVPRLLVEQLGFLYRYLFVLIDEAMRVRRARDFRGAARAPASRRLAAVGGIVGQLFLRTLDRSHRVYTAMCARGYRGDVRYLTRLKLRPSDGVFFLTVVVYLATCRWVYPLVMRGGMR